MRPRIGLGQVLNGWLKHNAAPTSYPHLRHFRRYLQWLWLRGRRKRLQKDSFECERLEALCMRFRPGTRIIHAWPEQRYALGCSRLEPCALRACTEHARGQLGNRFPCHISPCVPFIVPKESAADNPSYPVRASLRTVAQRRSRRAPAQESPAVRRRSAIRTHDSCGRGKEIP